MERTNNKKVLIIYTGGTIGMTMSSNGYVPELDSFYSRLNSMPELKSTAMPKWDIISINPLLDSSNIAVNEWNKIAGLLFENYEKYDGFVVLHGTDTMAYTASALSFILENNNKPIIMTGSQIPLCEIRNDARDNLIAAMMIAANDNIHEVCLYFGGKLFRGNRSTKYSAFGLGAFVSPNYPSLAEAGIEIKYNDAALKSPSSNNINLVHLDNVPIGVIKIFPGIQFELFEYIMTEKLKGIVIETFGAGNIPANSNALLPIIQKAYENGTIITVCSQCPQGNVSLGAYETSSALTSVGAISGHDMTTEAAVAKLYYLFSRGYSKDKIKQLMEIDISGELTIN